MSILDRIEIICGDIREVPCDLIVLKFADGLYGADLAVAERLEIDLNIDLTAGETRTYRNQGKDLGAQQVLYRGVGNLFSLRYKEIGAFAQAILEDAAQMDPPPQVIATTIHGPGYGLDETEAMMSQLAGFLAHDLRTPDTVRLIKIVEFDERRAHRLNEALERFKDSYVTATDVVKAARPFANFAFESAQKFLNQYIPVLPQIDMPSIAATPELPVEEKPVLFAAMPFADKYTDEFDIAFHDASHENGFICERLDRENYAGSVIDEIYKRIQNCSGLIALLNDNNPNVFFEVGYAMALGKPVLLVVKQDMEVAFDLRSQRHNPYSSIFGLRKKLTALIADLKSDGTLT